MQGIPDESARVFSDVLRRWGMYGVLALAMVPAIQCGIGPNFGITMGIVGGLLGGLVVIQLDIAQNPALVAILLSLQPGWLFWLPL